MDAAVEDVGCEDRVGVGLVLGVGGVGKEARHFFGCICMYDLAAGMVILFAVVYRSIDGRTAMIILGLK